MAQVFDFTKFKELKEYSEQLETEYLEFLPWIHKKLGVPTTLSSVLKTLFIVLRYLEGTINGFSIMTLITPIDRENIEEGKKLIIDWLENIIENVKAI